MSDQPGLRLVPIAANRPGTVKLDGVPQASIPAALAAARPGSVVEIGRGRYAPDTESFPLRIRDGVTVRGPEPPKIPEEARKFLPIPPPAEIIADSTVIEITGDQTHLAHLKIRTRHPGSSAAITIGAVQQSTLDTCEISGSVQLSDSQDVQVRWTTIEHGRLACRGTKRLQVTGGTMVANHGSGPLIEAVDSTEVRIEAAVISNAEIGVSAKRCGQVLVGGCAVLADADAVVVVDSQQVAVNGNRLRGRRAVHLIDCDDGEISANGIERADVAIELERCTGIDIGYNHFAEARINLVEHSG